MLYFTQVARVEANQPSCPDPTSQQVAQPDPPIRYEAVARCLAQVAGKAVELGAGVHMPRIGCGLAGGDWTRIEPLIVEHLGAAGVDVTVYDFD